MFVSDKIKSERRNICFHCEHRKKSVGGYTCGTLMIPTKKTCGCFIKAKTALSISECPSKKW